MTIYVVFRRIYKQTEITTERVSGFFTNPDEAYCVAGQMQDHFEIYRKTKYKVIDYIAYFVDEIEEDTYDIDCLWEEFDYGSN